jgi:type IV pilus assembly protein PilB
MMGLPQGKEYTFYRGEGCPDCFQTGYRGRIAAFEILTMTPEIRQAIHARSRAAMTQAVKDSRFTPILAGCADLVLEGITTVDEVGRTLGK